MPTPRDVIHREGSARLLRFRPEAQQAHPARAPGPAPAPGPAAAPAPAPAGAPAGAPAAAPAPVLLIPSLINRWYILDLRAGSSLIEALVAAGLDVWAIDWGTPGDEDRYLTWDDLLDRLQHLRRVVRRATRAARVASLGYCMGGTLAGIDAALHPDEVGGLINLAGPFDFAHAGQLATMVDARWFDAGAIAAAGNVQPEQMQAGFIALRPTLQLSKWLGLADRAHDPAARAAFEALETWSSDNVAFPGAAYATYIRELYQDNALIAGRHHVRGQRVDLGRIHCPVLTIAAERDSICPPAAARALGDAAGGKSELLMVPGGHVGAVIGARAQRALYPRVARWLEQLPSA